MWTSALKLLLSVLGFFFERFKQRQADTPENRRDRIHDAIAKGDENEINTLVDDAIQRTPANRMLDENDCQSDRRG